MIEFIEITLRNFLSFGNTTTAIDLTGEHITVIMGINHDTGGEDSRNGTGKSAIVDALSYVLYGKTLRDISNAKLVNKMARKGQGMLVTLDFKTKNGYYRIERGESPSKLKLFKKDLDDDNDILSRDGRKFVYEITRNKNETTEEISELIGFDLTLFEFLIANTTESQAFMKLPEAKRRSIIEHLMGLNLLSERAAELKEDRKELKKKVVAEESSLQATQQANMRITRQVEELQRKAKAWETEHDRRIKQLKKDMDTYGNIDIEEQVEILSLIKELKEESEQTYHEKRDVYMKLREAEVEYKSIMGMIDMARNDLEKLLREKEKLDNGTCPTCGQNWTPDHDHMKNVEDDIAENQAIVESSNELIAESKGKLDTLESKHESLDKDLREKKNASMEAEQLLGPFKSMTDVTRAQTFLEESAKILKQTEEEKNPFLDTIADLNTDAIKKIDRTTVDSIINDVLHYDYLIELLQSKDSFLRKSVINRWLPQLNIRINHYLDIMELPYTVRIEDDLSMEITSFGEDFSFGNLSKGQRQRVTIAVNFAFQDLFETTNHPINVLFVDELLDNGICQRGAAQAVKALQEITERKHKRVMLITHRQDISDQIDDMILVELKNRISRIDDDGMYDEPDEEEFI